MKRMKLIKLKMALFADSRKDSEIADKAGMASSRLSQIINGVYIPTDSDEEKIAFVLEKKREELFSHEI